ncbi:rna-directed dna polymerase from mobile element jockey-like [Limosa lapponica baueri]|uniref:Rna-directed dna polymerase from mobile element jockey-like n=1 Tax=Limosa lapponica baueri TaxID=1758121 RepID=A0A2I0UN48_LIMLA|nr:rna-directed dna polymerase from mobile element jockey-like [Limosa lapponica baueri]
MLFNNFISDLDNGIKCTLTKLANKIKLSGEVDTSEGRATLQEDLDRLEEWANKNLRKFNKGKCKVLHLGKHDPGVQHRLGSTRLRSSSVDLGVLVDKQLNMSEQCAAVATKANRMFWFLLYIKDVDGLEKIQTKATKMIKGLGSLPYEERLRELGLFSLEKRSLRGHLITMFQYLKGGYKEGGDSLFARSHMEKMRGKLMRYGWNRWIRSLTENCLELWIVKVVIRPTKSMWKLVTRGISEFAIGPNLGKKKVR